MLKLTKGSNETFKVSATEASGASKAGVTACLGASMRECHQAFKAAQTSNDASAQKPEEIHGTKLLAAGGIRVALSSAKFIREGDEKVPNNHSEKMSDRQLSETESSDEQSKGEQNTRNKNKESSERSPGVSSLVVEASRATRRNHDHPRRSWQGEDLVRLRNHRCTHRW